MAPLQQPTTSEFMQYVERCVYIHDLSPLITVPIVKTAVEQWRSVVHVEIVRNPLEAKHSAVSAIVEMSTPQAAADVLQQLLQAPFLLGCVARPVRAKKAVPAMFPDRPRVPHRPPMRVEWMDRSNPDWERCSKLKSAAQRHAAETQYLNKRLREHEEELAVKHHEKLRQSFGFHESVSSRQVEDIIRRYKRLLDHGSVLSQVLYHEIKNSNSKNLPSRV